MINRYFLLIIVFLVFCGNVMGQVVSAEARKNLKRADDLAAVGNYDEAIPLYESAVKAEPNNYSALYSYGVALFRSSKGDNQLLADEVFERVVAVVPDGHNIPFDAYFYLGASLHKSSRFDMAIKALDDYARTPNTPVKSGYMRLASEIKDNCQNALYVAEFAEEAVVVNFGNGVNTADPEYGANMSANENLFIFSSNRDSKQVLGETSKSSRGEFVFIMEKDNSGTWSMAKPFIIEGKNNLSCSFLSADGRSMIVYYDQGNGNIDLFLVDIQDGKGTKLREVAPGLNTKFRETAASLTADGMSVYFSSDRLGGYGGLDIYRMDKTDNGWSRPVNLGPAINTKGDEDSPFIHPDGKTLYFHSKGHNSIGGYDIFKTRNTRGSWGRPESLGVPINSPFDDMFFSLSPDGKKGYFNSNRGGGSGNQDIYFVGIPEEANIIPLTMVKGSITNMETGKPIAAKISVLDKETNKLLQNIYSPDPETGLYLMIFPPNKNYDMVIEAEGFKPYQVNIHIPNQTYFYELYQKIQMKPIKQFDEVVGQEISVQNAFYDVYGANRKGKVRIDPKMYHEAKLVKDSLDIFYLMEDIVKGADSVAFEYLLDLLFKINPVAEVNYNSDSARVAEVAYFYDDMPELVPVKLGDKVVYTLPGIDLVKNKKITEKQIVLDENVKLQVKSLSTIYFQKGKSNIEDKYLVELNKILAEVKDVKYFGIEISGFASNTGGKRLNEKLSNERAREVLRFFHKKGIPRRRIIARGFGELKNSNLPEEKSRKVDIRVVKIK